jgi:hypothetical protein
MQAGPCGRRRGLDKERAQGGPSDIASDAANNLRAMFSSADPADQVIESCEAGIQFYEHQRASRQPAWDGARVENQEIAAGCMRPCVGTGGCLGVGGGWHHAIMVGGQGARARPKLHELADGP